MTLDYRPDGISMWDTWYILHEGVVHMFHLQNLSKDSQRPAEDAFCMGHATSTDLLHWTEQPYAFCPNPDDPRDDLTAWSGCVHTDGNGKFYFYYTMRGSDANGYSQRIGLMLSDDLYTWTRYKNNPIIIPDPRYYLSYETMLPKSTVDCRDMVVVNAPDGNGYVGIFAARVPGREQAQTSVFGAARSQDLIHWEQLPPAFAPEKYADIEFPDVYYLDGRWYLTCLTGNRYGNRGTFSDPTVRYGTIYAVADRPEGPYHEIEGDNVLIGGQVYSGYSCRSLLLDGERHTLYTEMVPPGYAETVSPPMLTKALPDGRLRLAYNPRSAAWRTETLIEPGTTPPITKLLFTQSYWNMLGGNWTLRDGKYMGEAETGWQAADLGVGAENCEFEATVVLHSGVAVGLIYRPDSSLEYAGNDRGGATAFFLDAEKQQLVSARVPLFDTEHLRSFAVEYGKPYRLRVSVRPPRFEVYIDDILVMQSAIDWADLPQPGLGLFVDRGRAEVYDLAAYKLG